MQNAETVLGVLRERGRRGLSCNQLYRQLFNPQLYLLAYGRIYANHGSMTPGVTQETGSRAQAYEAVCRGTPVVWRKLDCLNPNPQMMQSSIRRKDARNRRHVL